MNKHPNNSTNSMLTGQIQPTDNNGDADGLDHTPPASILQTKFRIEFYDVFWINLRLT
jgi:hypothetical protein